MDNFNFKQRNLFSGPHLLGVILIFAGLLVFLSPFFIVSQTSLQKTYIVGGIALVIGLVIVSTYSGTQIDLSGKKSREYLSVGAYKTGKWVSLPQLIKIKVIAISFKNTNTPNGISPTLSGKVTEYKMLIIADNQQPAFSFIYANKDLAIKEAKRLSTSLGVILELQI